VEDELHELEGQRYRAVLLGNNTFT